MEPDLFEIVVKHLLDASFRLLTECRQLYRPCSDVMLRSASMRRVFAMNLRKKHMSA